MARVSDRENEENGKPAARPMRRRVRRRHNRGSGIVIALIAVGFAVLFIFVVGGVIAVALFRGKGGDGSHDVVNNLFSTGGNIGIGSQPVISKASLETIGAGMTLEEVQAKLGPGKQSTPEDLKIAFGNGSVHGGPNGPPEEQWLNNGRQAGVTSWYQWRTDDSSVFVGFANGKRTGKNKALLSFWVERFSVGGGLYGFRSEAGFMVMGDPDQITDARDAENRLLDDPKWKKGSARQFLPGRWKDSLRLCYEFKADGTMKGFGMEEYTSTYRFIDADHIEINVPASRFQPARLLSYQVLVTNDELLLVREQGNRRTIYEYKRVK